MNIEEFKIAIEICHNANIALYAHGPQGVGKSLGTYLYTANKFHFYKNQYNEVITDSEFEKIENKDGWVGFLPYFFVDFRVAQLEASEIRGLPEKDQESKKIFYYIPNQLPTGEYINEDGLLSNEKLPDGKKWTIHKGILFFDEINRGEDDVLNAIFQIVYDRKIENYVLPSGWGIVAAGNPSGSSFTVNSFIHDSAFKDRFCHVFIKIDDVYKQNWMSYMYDSNDNNDIVHNILHFCMLDDNNFYKHDDNDDLIIEPSPRSWSFVCKLENVLNKYSNKFDKSIHSKIRYELIRGLVGDVAGHYIECSIDILPKEIIEKGMSTDVVKRLEKLERNQIQALSWGISGQAKKLKDPSDAKMNNVISFGKWMMTKKEDFRDLAVAYFDSILQIEQTENVRSISIANKSLQNLLRKNSKNNSWFIKITDDKELENLLHLSHRGSL